jgi:hypothetical protein
LCSGFALRNAKERIHHNQTHPGHGRASLRRNPHVWMMLTTEFLRLLSLAVGALPNKETRNTYLLPLVDFVRENRLYPVDDPSHQISPGECVGAVMELDVAGCLPAEGVQFSPPNCPGGLLHHETLRNLLARADAEFRDAAPGFQFAWVEQLAAEGKLVECGDCEELPEGCSLHRWQ